MFVTLYKKQLKENGKKTLGKCTKNKIDELSIDALAFVLCNTFDV